MNRQILLFVMMTLPMVAGAFSGEAIVDGINYLIVTKAKTAEVRALPNGSKYTGDIVIPESIVYDGIECRVENINNNAFQNCNGLLSVTIPTGVTSIGGSAFSGCSSLVSVTIPSGVTSIGGSAFFGCTSLASITIPTGVTSIGGSAFSGCSSLTSITIPSGVTSI